MSATPRSGAAPTPLLIDCDPGVDDAAALALAIGSPELDLRAVTTVRGNVPLAGTTRNGLALLQLLGREDVPLAPGAAEPLVRDPGPHPPVHGVNGLGGVELPEAARAAQARPAIDLIAEVLRDAEPRSVTIAAIGPLTNIALFLGVHPELTDRIDRVVIMGGSAGAGNITPVAEFNIWGDPEAAHRVLAGSGLDICLVGLDATRRATLDEHHLAVLREASRECALLADMITGYGDRGSDGWALHDALAIAAIVDPTLISTRTAAVEVDTGLGIGRAQTVCVFDGWSAVSASVPLDAPASLARSEVAVDLDVERFRQLLLDRITAGVVSNAGA